MPDSRFPSDIRPRAEELSAQARAQARSLGAPAPAIAAALEGGDGFTLLEWLIPRRAELGQPGRELIATMEALLRIRTTIHPLSQGRGPLVPVVFGTGGHRGEIGWGLTLPHVWAILHALLDLIAAQPPEERRQHFGAATLEEVKQRGIVIGHDNRLFNPEFSFYSAHVLAEAGYRVAYAGRAATPELSFITPHQNWAASLNFTPSHNPFRYGGLKLAPADGGLAGNELTDGLEHRANKLLSGLKPEDWPAVAQLEGWIEAQRKSLPRVDIHQPYLEGLERHPVIRLGELIPALKQRAQAGGFHWVVDPVWGASVPVYQRLQERMGKAVLTLIHTEDDSYFGGQTTEPNEHTLAEAIELVRQHPATLKGCIRNDPDSDRGLVGDAGGAMKMNRYAVLVMRYLLELGRDGGLVTTLPTSHFGPDYARSRGKAVTITRTGFKNFRPHLSQGKALLAYEESDGLTIQGHTLDKDGIMACLLAMRMVLHYGRPLSTLLEEVQHELGQYYWLQDTFPINMLAKQAQQKLKALQAVQPGRIVQAGQKSYSVASINTEDGYKFVFSDGSWFMMRPSGTEPKVRVYAETRTSAADTQALCAAAKAMALEVMAK